jgi:hypothetical protein
MKIKIPNQAAQEGGSVFLHCAAGLLAATLLRRAKLDVSYRIELWAHDEVAERP